MPLNTALTFLNKNYSPTYTKIKKTPSNKLYNAVHKN